MKRILFPIIMLAVVLTAHASTPAVTDKPQQIVSFVKTEHDAKWYARQAELWSAQVTLTPDDDDAWINWFHATRYKQMFESEDNDYDEAPLFAIAEKVRKERPESYARYCLDYYSTMWLKGSNDLEDNMEKAIKMRPDNAYMYKDYVVYLLNKGNTELMGDILKKWYETGEFSYTLLSYAYNQLAGMEQNGILFVNGDIPTFSSLLIQYGKGLHADKTVICISLLYSPDYLKNICNQLGIPQISEPTDWTEEGMQKWEDEFFLAVADKTGRPIYFSTLLSNLPFKDKLYSEGLVYKYSPKRYDNLSVKRKNFEDIYLTDYLFETFTPETYEASAYRLNLNYIPCFKSLLDFYKENGDRRQMRKLYSMMKRIVARTENISDEERKRYNDEIDR